MYMASTLPTIKCPNPKCGAVTIKRVEKPVKCPRCGTKYQYDEEQKVEQNPEEVVS
jgi:hypothetical protein